MEERVEKEGERGARERGGREIEIGGGGRGRDRKKEGERGPS